jgi:nucleotide-binding universal stress UspA family protein
MNDEAKLTILCPVDFSEPCRVAMEHAESLARTLGAELILAHVVVPAMYPVAFGAVPLGAVTLEEEARGAAEASLTADVKRLSEQGITCRGLVEVGTPAYRLVEMVRENAVDLVVMGTHGATGLGHVLLGSTAERVVRLCPCPVLTVKVGQLVAS